MDIYGHLIPVMHKEIGNQMDEWLTPIPVEMGGKADIITIVEHIES
ncbi:MAG: hypothetical protein KKD28_11735 [Chloroflexi bacterium]|nr:hypothetical protein [Chloroflexota bacterium]